MLIDLGGHGMMIVTSGSFDRLFAPSENFAPNLVALAISLAGRPNERTGSTMITLSCMACEHLDPHAKKNNEPGEQE
jgi:hypothetical protein